MAKQEVHVNDIDVIRVYRKNFGDFYESFASHIQRFQKVLQEKSGSLDKIKREVTSKKEEIERKRRQSQADNPNYDRIMRACNIARSCEEFEKQRWNRANFLIQTIGSQASTLVDRHKMHVDNGRSYLEKIEQNIVQYMETQLDT